MTIGPGYCLSASRLLSDLVRLVRWLKWAALTLLWLSLASCSSPPASSVSPPFEVASTESKAGPGEEEPVAESAAEVCTRVEVELEPHRADPPGVLAEWIFGKRKECPELVERILAQSLPALTGEDHALTLWRLALVRYLYLEMSAEAVELPLEQAAAEAQALALPCLYLKAQRLLLQRLLSPSQPGRAAAVAATTLPRVEDCENPEDQARTFLQISELRRQQNRQLEQFYALEQVRQRAPEGSEDALVAGIQLAALRHDLGDVTDEGEGYLLLLEQAEALRAERHVIELKSNLAHLYRDLGRFADARQLLLECLGGVSQNEEASVIAAELPLIHLDLAWIAVAQRDPALTRFHLERAPITAFAGHVTRHQHLRLLTEGELALLEGRTADARGSFSLIKLEQGAEPESAWRAALGLAQAAKLDGKAEERRQQLFAAIQMLEAQRAQTAPVFWRLSYLSQRVGLYQEWLEALLEAYSRSGAKYAPGDRLPPESRFASGKVTADDLLSALEKISSQSFMAELLRDRGIESLLEAPADTPFPADEPGKWISGAALRSLLPAELPVLFLEPLSDSVLLLEVRRAAVRVHRLPLDREALKADLLKLEASLRTEQALPEPVLEILGRHLLEPLEASLPRNGEPLGFVLGQELEDLPLAALKLKGHYLVERVSPFELPSLRAIKALSRKETAARAPRSLGVAFGPDLTHAVEELELLPLEKGDRLLLQGEQATRAHVLEALEKRDLIHLAMHASPPSSTGPKSAPRQLARLELADGGLTVTDISRKHLSARLAVLSGCETRVGRRGLAEHGYGALHRAFLVAGAEAVIASRWKVADAATAALMRHLYSLYPQRGRAVALAEAQRQLIAMADSRPAVFRRHLVYDPTVSTALNPADVALSAPFSWAAFTLVGRWD